MREQQKKVADRSAVEDVKARYAMPVVAIADLSDLMSFLKETKDPELSAYQEAISEYRRKYGSNNQNKQDGDAVLFVNDPKVY